MWRTLDGPRVWQAGRLCREERRSRMDVETTSGDDEVKWQRCKRAARPPVGQHHPGAEGHPERQHRTRVMPECIYFMPALTFIYIPQRSPSRRLFWNTHAHRCRRCRWHVRCKKKRKKKDFSVSKDKGAKNSKSPERLSSFVSSQHKLTMTTLNSSLDFRQKMTKNSIKASCRTWPLLLPCPLIQGNKTTLGQISHV